MAATKTSSKTTLQALNSTLCRLTLVNPNDPLIPTLHKRINAETARLRKEEEEQLRPVIRFLRDHPYGDRGAKEFLELRKKQVFMKLVGSLKIRPKKIPGFKSTLEELNSTLAQLKPDDSLYAELKERIADEEQLAPVIEFLQAQDEVSFDESSDAAPTGTSSASLDESSEAAPTGTSSASLDESSETAPTGRSSASLGYRGAKMYLELETKRRLEDRWRENTLPRQGSSFVEDAKTRLTKSYRALQIETNLDRVIRIRDYIRGIMKSWNEGMGCKCSHCGGIEKVIDLKFGYVIDSHEKIVQSDGGDKITLHCPPK